MCPTENISYCETIIKVTPNVVATIVGGLIGYFSARRISNLTARLQAISNLRASFAPQLAYLRGMGSSEGDSGSLESVREYLYTAFIGSHASELEKFRFFVKNGDITAYDKACEDYEHQLYPGFNVDTKGKTPQEYFIAQIEDLLHLVD